MSIFIKEICTSFMSSSSTMPFFLFLLSFSWHQLGWLNHVFSATYLIKCSHLPREWLSPWIKSAKDGNGCLVYHFYICIHFQKVHSWMGAPVEGTYLISYFLGSNGMLFPHLFQVVSPNVGMTCDKKWRVTIAFLSEQQLSPIQKGQVGCHLRRPSSLNV